jgi:endoglucanase
MPACPADLKGTWVEGSLASAYKTDGTVAQLRKALDIAIAFKNSRKVKVYCGEFGVYSPYSDPADRAAWYDTVRAYLEQNGISWTIWDYHGGFGIFRPGTSGLFESDLDTTLVNELGLNAPEQISRVITPDTTGFHIYYDYTEKNLVQGTSLSAGSVDFFCPDSARAGHFSIKMSGVNQYNNFGFDFVPDRDLSILKANQYFLEFWMRSNLSTAQFDIRFLDTKTGPDDHPWRNRRTISKSVVPMDGRWHYVKLPLSSFTEHGAWDNNAWYNPAGKFDWKAIDRLDFVAEEASLTGVTLGFDLIGIADTTLGVADVPGVQITLPTASLAVYPNPLQFSSTLHYRLSSSGPVDISLYSLMGQKICTLVNRYQSAGEYELPFSPSEINISGNKPGVYFCRMSCGGFSKCLTLLVRGTE